MHMKKMTPYLKWALIPIFIAAAAAVLALFASYTRTDLEKLYLTPIVSDPNGWEIYVMEDGQRVYLTPQELLDIDLNRTYYLTRVLTQDMRDRQYTLLNLNNYLPTAIFLDGKLIYNNCCGITPRLDDTVFPQEFNGFGMRGEHSYCTLPEDYVGRRLTLATTHMEYKSMPMIVMSSMTVGWGVYGSIANRFLFPALCFAVTAVILFGIWLYGVFCGIRDPAVLIVIAAAMTRSFSYLRQYGMYSPVPTAMDTPLQIYVPIIAVWLPQVYFLLKLDKKRNRILYGIFSGIATAAAAAFQTAEFFGTPFPCEIARNIMIYLSIAVFIVFAVLEAKNGNKLFRVFLGGLAAVLLGVSVLYLDSLAGDGVYAENMRSAVQSSFIYNSLDIINFIGMVLFVLSAVVSFYSLMRHTVQIQTYFAVQNERLEQLDRDLETQKLFYESKLTKENEIRALRHDMDGHLSTIMSLLCDNKQDEAKSYLSGIIKLHGERKFEPICDNPYMNAVLTEYRTKCNDSGVSFVCHAAVGDSELPATEICLILNNALENAFEACMKLPESERKIKVQAAVKQRRFLLRVSNRFNGVIRESDGFPVSEKEGKEHGYGLSNILRAAQKRGGSMACRTENGYFVLDVEFKLL